MQEQEKDPWVPPNPTQVSNPTEQIPSGKCRTRRFTVRDEFWQARAQQQLVGNMHQLALTVWILVFLTFLSSIASQLPIPSRYDGFVFSRPSSTSPIVLEAFMDPLCPDSRDVWPSVKEVAENYIKDLLLIVHPFALPYHHNSYFTCRALHIANGINSSLTAPLLEEFFEHQDIFANQQTIHETPTSVLDRIVQFASHKFSFFVGNEFESQFQSGFEDSSTDLATRISFEYGCSRAVIGTPYFFLNGIPLFNADSSWDYLKWRSVIDPLMYPSNESVDV